MLFNRMIHGIVVLMVGVSWERMGPHRELSLAQLRIRKALWTSERVIPKKYSISVVVVALFRYGNVFEGHKRPTWQLG